MVARRNPVPLRQGRPEGLAGGRRRRSDRGQPLGRVAPAIASIDEKEHVVHFTKRSVFLLEAGDRYWVEERVEFLTEPGEFYVDPRAKAVFLIAPAGLTPAGPRSSRRAWRRCCDWRASPPRGSSSSTSPSAASRFATRSGTSTTR